MHGTTKSFYIYSMYSVTELALVTHKPRAASAYAVGEVRCAGNYTFFPAPVFLIRTAQTTSERKNKRE